MLIQRRQAVLDKARQELESNYPKTKITTYAASVTDYDRVSSILKEVGKIDILVPNAGVSHPFVPSKDISTADFKTTFDVNVVSVFHIIREYLALESSGPRVIINTSSAASHVAFPGQTGYGPSKAAANQMIRRLATDYASVDVTMQTFHPGAVYTETAARLLLDMGPEGSIDFEDGTLTLLLPEVADLLLLQ